MEKDTIDRQDDPDFNLGVFLRNAYNHPDFTDEPETSDVEQYNTQEDDRTALQARAYKAPLSTRML